MEFVAAVVAIVAIILVIRLRNRTALLEQHVALINQHLATRRSAPPQAAVEAAPERAPEPQTAPVATSAEPVPAAAAQSEDDALIEQVVREQPFVPPPAPPAPARKSFEERFGASWVVWIGGLALALGGIFLVQYSIEAGLIGPGVRVFLGGLLATALIAGGEWMRRHEFALPLAGVPTANMPAMLTAAGTTVAFATVYAAYALYGFIGPAAAFVLLGIVALATLAAALLHGPWLAALGQLGAFVAPMLVATPEPNYWALYIYLVIVTAASFALARARLWRELAMTAVAFAVLWAFAGIADLRFGPEPVALYLVAGFALAAALMVSGLLYGPDAEAGQIDAVSSGALSAFLLATAVLVLARDHDGLALIAFSSLVVATVAIAWRTDAAVAAVPVAGALAALVIADWAVEIQWQTLVVPGGPAVAPDPSRLLSGTHLALGGAFAALFAGAGFLVQGRSPRPEAPIIWAATAVIAPLAILVALYYRIYGFERSLPFAALALFAAALFAVATEMLGRGEPRPGQPSAAAIFATGSIAALALGLTFALENGWLTVALALMVPGTAYVAEHRPLAWLRTMCGVLVALVILRIGYEPRIVAGPDATPIFNWILYGYGIPALAFWVAGWLLRKRADDVPSRIVDAGAILFTVLTATLQIRHAIYGGNIYHASAGLTEVALQVSGGLAMVIGLERLRLRTNSVVHNVAALLIAAVCLFVIVFGLLLLENPWLWSKYVGGLFLNLNLLGYAIPAALAATIGLMTRQTRPQSYRTVAAVTAVVLALAYLSFQVSRVYHGPRLNVGPITSAEGYTYSAVWLAFGVVLLVVGMWLRSAPVRHCAAAVVLATVAKVFLLDMAGLGGVWRSLSFIGLGLVLVGIWYLYRRILFAKPNAPPAGEQA